MQNEAPDVVRPINSEAELQALCSHIGHTTDHDFTFGEQEALAGDLLHLRPQEVLCIPFLLQVFKGPSSGALPAAPPDGAPETAVEATQHASPDDLRTVNIRLVQRVTGDEVRACNPTLCCICNPAAVPTPRNVRPKKRHAVCAGAGAPNTRRHAAAGRRPDVPLLCTSQRFPAGNSQTRRAAWA